MRGSRKPSSWKCEKFGGGGRERRGEKDILNYYLCINNGTTKLTREWWGPRTRWCLEWLPSKAVLSDVPSTLTFCSDFIFSMKLDRLRSSSILWLSCSILLRISWSASRSSMASASSIFFKVIATLGIEREFPQQRRQEQGLHLFISQYVMGLGLLLTKNTVSPTLQKKGTNIKIE